MLKPYVIHIFDISWTYSSWVCCECREANEKAICWKCGHTRCNSCQDGW